MCRKGNSNMLSVNSNPTNAMAFKGKPSAKDLKKAYEAMEKAHWNAIMQDPGITKEVKVHLLRNDSVPDKKFGQKKEKINL